MLSRIAIVTFSLILAVICAPFQPSALAQRCAVPRQPSIQNHTANGCQGEYETMDQPGGHIDAYPGWPPRVQPDHIVVHYHNGPVIWEKPSYGGSQCGHFTACRRATFIANPTYAQCTAQGHLYEVIALDGKSVLDSRLLQIIDRAATSRTVDVAFACSRGFAGPDFPSIGARISQAECMSGSIKHGMPLSAIPTVSTSQEHPYAKGMTLVAAAILGMAYFDHRTAVSAQPTPVTCTTNQLGMTAWTTTCR